MAADLAHSRGRRSLLLFSSGKRRPAAAAAAASPHPAAYCPGWQKDEQIRTGLSKFELEMLSAMLPHEDPNVAQGITCHTYALWSGPNFTRALKLTMRVEVTDALVHANHDKEQECLLREE